MVEKTPENSFDFDEFNRNCLDPQATLNLTNSIREKLAKNVILDPTEEAYQQEFLEQFEIDPFRALEGHIVSVFKILRLGNISQIDAQTNILKFLETQRIIYTVSQTKKKLEDNSP